jgi:hypothetical protein
MLESLGAVFYASDPASSTDAIAVASVDTTYLTGWQGTMSDGREFTYQVANSFAIDGEVPLYTISQDISSPVGNACVPYTGPDMSDGVVVIGFAGCATATKVCTSLRSTLALSSRRPAAREPCRQSQVCPPCTLRSRPSTRSRLLHVCGHGWHGKLPWLTSYLQREPQLRHLRGEHQPDRRRLHREAASERRQADRSLPSRCHRHP